MTSAIPTRKQLVQNIWRRFKEVGFAPDFGAGGSRLIIALYRQLARDGEPISRDDAMGTAARLGVASEEAAEIIERVSERDEGGAIRGIVGLSLNDHPHTFRFGEVELRNWCALDPLLIIRVLNGPVTIESADPSSGKPVTVTATADGIEAYEPSTTVMSVVIPESGATESLESIWMTFCHQVHFFENQETAERYFADKKMEVHFLTPNEAFDLGGLTFAPLYRELAGMDEGPRG